MKPSERAHKFGIDAFSSEDFKYVGGKVAKDPERLVLVGGQSLEVWGRIYQVPFPGGQGAISTEDADWHGHKLDAKWLCDQLPGTELFFPQLDDHTPSTATAYVDRPQARVVMMDFLGQVFGLDDEEVTRLAVSVELDGIVIKVLHPLLCLESRLANLSGIPAKRTGNGQLQARWIIDIVRTYLRARIAEGASAREITRACTRISDIARSKHARYCFVNYGLDPMEAVPPDVVAAVGGKFEEIEWPRRVAYIAAQHQKWKRMATSLGSREDKR